jgi:amidohydrolase
MNLKLDHVGPDLYDAALARRDRLVQTRRHLHQHPEVSLREVNTAAFIEAELDRLGVPHERVGATGVLGHVWGGRGQRGPTVCLRADFDALPVQETADVPYRSLVDGAMHACGHDAHLTCLLGAAELLCERRDEFAGEVRLVFQPGEEIGAGARPFVEAGCLAGVERIFGLHTASDLPCGTVGVKTGVNNASVDHFTVTVHGKSAHVSTPQRGVDALYVASAIVVGLQALVTRRTSPVEPLIIGVGSLHAGTTYNALAESAVMEGTTRAVSVELRAWVKENIDALVQATAAAYGATATVEWEDFTAPLVNDAEPCDEARSVVDAVLGAGHVERGRALSLGGDNFADLMVLPDPAVPGAYLYLGTCSERVAGSGEPHHSCTFDIDEDALPIGVAVLAGCALAWVQTPQG